MMAKKLKKWIAFLFIYLCNLLPIRNNKIMFFSYYGSSYGCNPKYISEYITAHAADQFDIVWAFTNVDEKQEIEHARKVRMMSLKYFYELCTAKVIITNYRTTEFFMKRKKQYYIQTWHSSLRLKQIEKDATAVLSTDYITMAKKDAAKCDLLLSGCQYSTEIFQRAFWYDGEIFEHGTPRNDLLLQPNQGKRKEILQKLKIPEEKKIVLYAPTFRKENQLTIYDLDDQHLSEVLGQKFGDEWVVLVRLHPHLLGMSKQLLPNNVADVTSYDDIQELLLAADVLITDYASLMFDFMITERPCFLYVPDVEEYISRERKLYFELATLPFIYAANNKKLFEKIEQFSAEKYEQDIAAFLQKIQSYENGNACEKLVNRIEEVCLQEKGREWNEAL